MLGSPAAPPGPPDPPISCCHSIPTADGEQTFSCSLITLLIDVLIKLKQSVYQHNHFYQAKIIDFTVR